MYKLKSLKSIIFGFLLISYIHASELARVEEELLLGRDIPAYFKIMDFDKEKWERFSNTFSDHPVDQAIKEHLESIQLVPLVFSRDEIFSTAYFKGRMRQIYCELFGSTKNPAPLLSVTNDEMYAGILNLLADSPEDTAKFEQGINQEMEANEKVIDAYNHRLQSMRGNSALLRHYLEKIFFAPNAYTDETLLGMRLTLLTEELVAGDEYLFAPEKNPTHTVAQSILKCIELKGAADTLVIGCGNSLIADVIETPPYFAEEFLKAFSGKTFVHDCQHCLCDHSAHISVAITEPPVLEAQITYNGAAHADIFADAKRPEFWAALKRLNDIGRSPFTCIIDHAYMLKEEIEQVSACLPMGGVFRSYIEFGTPEIWGFEKIKSERFGTRTEYVYEKVSESLC